MIELSENLRAKAKQAAKEFDQETALSPPHSKSGAQAEEANCAARVLGRRVATGIAMTPASSGLASALQESSLPLETREVAIWNRKYLLFAVPDVEKLVQTPILAEHLAEQMAAKFEAGCEGPVYARVQRDGDQGVTFLVLDRAEQERAIHETWELPFVDCTVEGKNYVVYGCDRREFLQHPVARNRAVDSFLKAVRNTVSNREKRREMELHNVARILGL